MMYKTMMVSLPGRVCDYCISVDFDDSELYASLTLLYGKYVARKYHSGRQVLNILVQKFENNSYLIRYENCSVLTRNLVSTLKNIFCLSTFFCSNILALHGAAVSYNSQAYIFLSSTAGGKSTLASYLTLNGFGYITDDCVLIDEETLKIVPSSTPIHLRAGGKKLLENEGFLEDSHLTLTKEINRHVYFPENLTDAPIRIARIYFSSFGRENAVENISNFELLLRIMRSPIIEYKINLDYMKKISSISQIPSYHITYSDMDFVKKCMQKEN